MIIREEIANTDRGPMAWLEAGAGWPVVLVHGFPFNAGMWRPQLENVPEGWRFIAPDLRRFGRTPGDVSGRNAPPHPIGMDDYAADVFALMDRLEIDEGVVGGLSMGGYITFAMYRQTPERFTGMILADTRSQADSAQQREGRVAMRRLLAERGPAGVASEMLPKLLSPAASPAVVESVRRMIESAPAAAIDAAIGALMDRPDSTPDLARISCAAIALVGREDAITPVADAEAMQRALQRSVLTVIPDAGHVANLEQPAAFSRALADFLRSAL